MSPSECATATPGKRLSWWLKDPRRAFLFQSSVSALESELGRPITPVERSEPGATHEELVARVQTLWPADDRRFTLREISLAGELAQKATAYWQRFEANYHRNGAEREKALEHALTFELLDFSRVARYCDVAADSSPVVRACQAQHGKVEVFRQDLKYQTDFELGMIGGFAQDMREIEAGFFDVLSLHCSYEHFAGPADTEFVAEVDRVLGPTGACLIVPLYVASSPRIYFDPTRVSASTLASYDREAQLCATFNYGETHGRYYSPESLWDRVLSRVPAGLQATLLSFRDQRAVDPSVYVRFGLILHRTESVVR